MARPGRVFSRHMLLEQLWGDASYRDPRTIDVHIRHLREKLEADSRRPEVHPDGPWRRLPLPRAMNPFRSVGALPLDRALGRHRRRAPDRLLHGRSVAAAPADRHQAVAARTSRCELSLQSKQALGTRGRARARISSIPRRRDQRAIVAATLTDGRRNGLLRSRCRADIKRAPQGLSERSRSRCARRHSDESVAQGTVFRDGEAVRGGRRSRVRLRVVRAPRSSNLESQYRRSTSSSAAC